MKRILSMLLAAAVVLSTMLCLPFSVSAESLYIRKIVSVVYDDSGSMRGDKWAYANYAMQAFCGMLNSEDQLFITYMRESEMNSNYEPEEVDLSAGGIQNSVDAIRQRILEGSTPYRAVEIAYDKLKSVNDPNPNTQYWLVVITDGVFNECDGWTVDRLEEFLNDEFEEYTKGVMPNGTNPQVTFLGIGDIASPEEDHDKGIYTYSTSDADGIMEAMSEMADRVSGRTRLKQSDMKQIDAKTIQVSSSIPLLNIAVLAQESDANITEAVCNNEVTIPVSRKASLSYPTKSNLLGGAYLLGDSQTVIGSGTYNITFDKDIDLSNVVVLFEPALEMRMTISVNGKEIADYHDLDDVMEGDKVSVSCKIYEMGTQKEIDPSLLPPGTKFEVDILEDGKLVQNVTGADMLLSDYELHDTETEISGAVTIEGFNPIDYSVKFTPSEYVPAVVYTMDSAFGSDVRSVRFDNIGSNQDLTVCFTVYADGVAMTDPEAVKALNPVVQASPQGNDGTVTYSKDGKIVFTPNTASMTSTAEGSFDVDVTCTLSDGTTDTETYTVLISAYQVVPVGTTDTVKKTEFFNNPVSASFYITKDGVKLDKAAVEDKISVSLNEGHSALKTSATVANDGTITVTPYTDVEHKLTFWNWWTNWAYYFGLEGSDVVVTLNHAYGTGESAIDVVGEDLLYQILNVYLPLIIEIVALAFFITWIILVVTKPKYSKGAKLYVGSIWFNQYAGTHTLKNFSAIKLAKFNKITKRKNGRLKFKKTADVVSAGGVKIRADRGNRIICEMPFPWYKGEVEPKNSNLAYLETPADIVEYIGKNQSLEIVEFSTTETVNAEYNRGLTPANPHCAKYIVVADPGGGTQIVNGRTVIKSGKLFIYINV